jgi:hypothetical protein
MTINPSSHGSRAHACVQLPQTIDPEAHPWPALCAPPMALGHGLSIVFGTGSGSGSAPETFYLLDGSGNILTDGSGNRLTNG